jgi:hypothetical protein
VKEADRGPITVIGAEYPFSWIILGALLLVSWATTLVMKDPPVLNV